MEVRGAGGESAQDRSLDLADMSELAVDQGWAEIASGVWPKNSCGPPVVILEKTAESLVASDRWSIRRRQLVSPRK
jgi:hypothetical protein